MAAVVDRVSFLVDIISKQLTGYSDILALLGTYYTVKQTFTTVCCVYNAAAFYFGGKIVKLNVDIAKKYGKWAVITGSTDGIGKAFAQELASRGVNIILVSRNKGKLSKVAKEIEKFNVETVTIAADFTEGEDIYPNIESRLNGREVGILINNVGVMYDHPMPFLEVKPERLWQLIHVNIAAATMMSHIVLPQMVQRGRGLILNMSSAVCRHPNPQLSVYAATKKYIQFLSLSLHEEYKSNGIHVQCLMPSYIATRMTLYSETLSNPNTLIPTASWYAREALNTLGLSTCTTGYWPHSILAWFGTWFSESTWISINRVVNNALRRQAVQRRRSTGNRS